MLFSDSGLYIVLCHLCSKWSILKQSLVSGAGARVPANKEKESKDSKDSKDEKEKDKHKDKKEKQSKSSPLDWHKVAELGWSRFNPRKYFNAERLQRDLSESTLSKDDQANLLEGIRTILTPVVSRDAGATPKKRKNPSASADGKDSAAAMQIDKQLSGADAKSKPGPKPKQPKKPNLSSAEFTVHGLPRKRKLRRKVTDFPPEDRWTCPRGCGKQYHKTR